MTPLKILGMSQALTDVYEKMEYDLMMNVVKNIRNYDQVTPTGQWQLQKLAEMGKLNKQNIKIMSDALGGASGYFESMITDAAIQTITEIEPAYKAAVKDGILQNAVDPMESPNIKQAMKVYEKQAKKSLNLVNTTMLHNTKEMYATLINDTCSMAEKIAQNQEAINLLNKGAGQVISGAESRQQALRKTLKDFNNRGITAFIDKGGKHWTPEAYTNMVLRSTVGSVSNSTQLARADDYGVDYLEVSSHSGARPKCAKDQGKIFCKSGKDKKYPAWKSSSYGQPDGLLGINCGHSVYPFVPGVNIQRYFPLDEKENDEQYKKNQGQRSIERDVRKSKRELALFDTIGDKESFQMASANLKLKEKKLAQYCSDNSLPRRRNREQVEGFGKGTSARAIEANSKVLHEKYKPYLGTKTQKVTIDKIRNIEYNNDERLLTGFAKAVDKGDISVLVGIDTYINTAREIEKELVGLNTTNDIKVTGYVNHFIDRVIGQTSASAEAISGNRQGVLITDVKEALTKGIAEEQKTNNGKASQRFVGSNCIVSINYETGKLIQVNKKKVK